MRITMNFGQCRFWMLSPDIPSITRIKQDLITAPQSKGYLYDRHTSRHAQLMDKALWLTIQQGAISPYAYKLYLHIVTVKVPLPQMSYTYAIRILHASSILRLLFLYLDANCFATLFVLCFTSCMLLFLLVTMWMFKVRTHRVRNN